MKATVKLPKENTTARVYSIPEMENGKVYQAVGTLSDMHEFVITTGNGLVNIDENGNIKMYNDYNDDELRSDLETDNFILRSDLDFNISIQAV